MYLQIDKVFWHVRSEWRDESRADAPLCPAESVFHSVDWPHSAAVVCSLPASAVPQRRAAAAETVSPSSILPSGQNGKQTILALFLLKYVPPSSCSTHQFIQVLLFLCDLLLRTAQPVGTFFNLLLQTCNLRRNPVHSIITQSEQLNF